MRLKALRDEIADVSFIATKNETEALLLEAQLVKEQQPKFNVLLKEGQPFLYILFSETSVELVRLKKKKGTYYGPFLHKSSARKAYAYLLRTFRLKLCNKKIPGGCLDYHLELCPGSCMQEFDLKSYKFRLDLAQQALADNHTGFIKNLRVQIAKHSLLLEFEKARTLREYLQNFETIFATLRTHFHEKKYERETAMATTPTSYAPQPSATVAQELQTLAGLDKAPVTIDCFDVSHFQGQSIVGSCVRFTNGLPDKNKFRRFRVKTLKNQNDYAGLREIVGRRYKLGDHPDLVVIDGGKGQLSAVADLIPGQLVSLAKGEHRDHQATLYRRDGTGVPVDIKSEAGRLLLALRDYAHHFAVSYHRKKQSLSS